MRRRRSSRDSWKHLRMRTWSYKTDAGSACRSSRGASPRIRSTVAARRSWWTTPTRAPTRGNDPANGASREASLRLQAHSGPEAADARRCPRVPAGPAHAHADAGRGAAQPVRGDARGGLRRDEEGFRVVAEDEVELGRRAHGAAGCLRDE